MSLILVVSCCLAKLLLGFTHQDAAQQSWGPQLVKNCQVVLEAALKRNCCSFGAWLTVFPDDLLCELQGNIDDLIDVHELSLMISLDVMQCDGDPSSLRPIDPH